MNPVFLRLLNYPDKEALLSEPSTRSTWIRASAELREISGFDATVSVESIFWHPDAGTSIEKALAVADSRMYDDKQIQRSSPEGRFSR